MRPIIEQLESRDCPSVMPHGLPDIPNAAWVHIADGWLTYGAGNICTVAVADVPADLLAVATAQARGAFIPVAPLPGAPFDLRFLIDLGPQQRFVPDPVMPTADTPMPLPSKTGTWVESRAWVTGNQFGELTLHAAYRDSLDGVTWGPAVAMYVPPELLHPLTFQVA